MGRAGAAPAPCKVGAGCWTVWAGAARRGAGADAAQCGDAGGWGELVLLRPLVRWVQAVGQYGLEQHDPVGAGCWTAWAGAARRGAGADAAERGDAGQVVWSRQANSSSSSQLSHNALPPPPSPAVEQAGGAAAAKAQPTLNASPPPLPPLQLSKQQEELQQLRAEANKEQLSEGSARLALAKLQSSARAKGGARGLPCPAVVLV